MRPGLILVMGFSLLGWIGRGEVYGTVKLGDQLLEGVTVQLMTATDTASAKTDKYGAYRLYLKANGKCTLRVLYKDQAPTLGITSGTEPVRYRLLLEESKGTYTLRSE